MHPCSNKENTTVVRRHSQFIIKSETQIKYPKPLTHLHITTYVFFYLLTVNKWKIAHTLRPCLLNWLMCVDDLPSSLEIKEWKQNFVETWITLSLQYKKTTNYSHTEHFTYDTITVLYMHHKQ